MSVRFPTAPSARSLGVGLDLPWAGEVGLAPDADGREGPTERTRLFFAGEGASFGHAFVSLQARDRSRPSASRYAPAWDALMACVPQRARGLHHTALSLGSLAPVRRGDVLALTAAIVERHGIAWVNEDLGFWSLGGRPLPYPLPPVLDARALPSAVRAVRECQRGLPVPLVVEFPGFSGDASVALGRMHAYDFLRALAEDAEAPVTLDVGHLLSYQWLRGKRGEALFDELARLPLAHAFELHLAGSSIVDGHFVDAHHGALLDAQLELVVRLAPLCPNLRAITFEDPVLQADGSLDAPSAVSLVRLRACLAPWLAGASESTPVRRSDRERVAEIELAPLEAAMAAEVAGRSPHTLEPDLATLATPVHGTFAGVRALWRSRALGRVHRGLGTLETRFPTAFAAWHASGQSTDALAAALLASDEAMTWREGMTEHDGASIEEAFAAFADRCELGDAVAREDDAMGAVLRALTLVPEPAFRVPTWVAQRGRGHFAVTRRGPPVLHAAIEGRYLRGAITPLLVDLLDGAGPGDIAARRGVPIEGVARAHDELAKLGL